MSDATTVRRGTCTLSVEGKEPAHGAHHAVPNVEPNVLIIAIMTTVGSKEPV